MESDKTGDTLPINEDFTIHLSTVVPVDEWGNPIDGATKPPIQKVTSTVGTVSIDREAGTATITGNATKDVEIVGIAKMLLCTPTMERLKTALAITQTVKRLTQTNLLK